MRQQERIETILVLNLFLHNVFLLLFVLFFLQNKVKMNVPSTCNCVPFYSHLIPHINVHLLNSYPICVYPTLMKLTGASVLFFIY